MLKILIILILVFIFLGMLRRMMFGSFFAAMQKHQRDLEKREQEERTRKREGKVFLEKIEPGKSIGRDEGEYVDYEEVK